MEAATSSLTERVQQALAGSAFVNARHVRCEVRDGAVILSGVLPTYYQKQMAQEQLLGLDGVGPVYNEIQVRGRCRPAQPEHALTSRTWLGALATTRLTPIRAGLRGAATA